MWNNRANREEYTVDGHQVYLVPDELMGNPRESWDHLGIMTCLHQRYQLGDNPGEYSARDFNGWSELAEELKERGAVVLLPLYLLDHSGITMSVGSFHNVDPGGWDSGRVGFIWTTRERVKARSEWKRLTQKRMREVEEWLRAEVREYDQWLTGDVWGYQVVDGRGEELDSCWGFLGMDEARLEADRAVRTTVTQQHVSAYAANIACCTP